MWKVNRETVLKLSDSLTLSGERGGETLFCFNEEGIPFALGKKFANKPISRERVSFNFLGTPRPYQEEALQRAIPLLLEERSLLLNYPTAFGKTFCSIYLASLTTGIVCVVYPFLTLEQQWKKSFSDLTTAKVYVNNGKKIEEDVQVILTTPGKLHKLPLQLKERIGCLICDEAHLFTTNLKYQALLSLTPDYCLGLSATLEKEPYQVKALELIFGKTLVEKQKKKASIFRVYTNISLPVTKNKKGKEDWCAFCKNTAEHEERNKKIAEDILSHPGKILVLTLRVIQAKTLYSLLKERGEEVSLFINNNKSYTESRVLISTAKKAGTGFDDANSSNNFNGKRFSLLVLTFSVKEVLFLKQLLGRVFRVEKPDILEYVDEHFLSYNHARKRDIYYESQGYDLYIK